METFESGYLHSPEQDFEIGLALTHGAGANCQAPLLIGVAETLAEEGILVYRYDLPFRRKRPHGPPFPSKAQADREGIREAVEALRTRGARRVFAGGHSYGGRQTTMLAAEHPGLVDGLVLLSYPLHPPAKPAQLRTEHFPRLRQRALFVQGSKDPFGSLAEIEEALRLIPAEVQLEVIDKAGHDLGRKGQEVGRRIASWIQGAGNLTPPRGAGV